MSLYWDEVDFYDDLTTVHNSLNARLLSLEIAFHGNCPKYSEKFVVDQGWYLWARLSTPVMVPSGFIQPYEALTFTKFDAGFQAKKNQIAAAKKVTQIKKI